MHSEAARDVARLRTRLESDHFKQMKDVMMESAEEKRVLQVWLNIPYHPHDLSSFLKHLYF